jgi:hypothetical protein
MAAFAGSNVDLVRASDDLYYELTMLKSTAQKLESTKNEPRGVVENALLESFAIHARCLIQFLYGKEKEEYVTASHYVDGWIPTKTNALGRTVGRASEEIVHLSFKRVNLWDEAKKWDLYEIEKQISEAFTELLKRVPDEKLGLQMRTLKADSAGLARFRLLKGTTGSTSSTFTVLGEGPDRNITGLTS